MLQSVVSGGYSTTSAVDQQVKARLEEALASAATLKAEAGEAAKLKERCAELEKTVAALKARMVKSGIEPRPRSMELFRLERLLHCNCAKEMQIAREGRVLQKVTEKHSTSEVRLVAIADDDMQLRWGHAPGPLDRKSKNLDLRTVVRFDFGMATRMPALFPGVQPWLCFTLHSGDRPYEFICPDEFAARCFVTVLGVLLRKQVTGNASLVRNRRDFVRLKGWCKIQAACAQQKTTPARALLALLKKAQPAPKAATMDDFLKSDTAAAVPTPSLLSIETKPAAAAAASTGAVSTKFATGKSRDWPKPGETWVFTGQVADVNVFEDDQGQEWVNQLKCRRQGERMAVTIVSADKKKRFIEIRGTDKMKFVKGFIELVDAEGNWLLEKATL